MITEAQRSRMLDALTDYAWARYDKYRADDETMECHVALLNLNHEATNEWDDYPTGTESDACWTEACDVACVPKGHPLRTAGPDVFVRGGRAYFRALD